MGKLIPPRPNGTEHQAVHSMHVMVPRHGPLEEEAHALRERLRSAEEHFELDELDRLARRHARGTASGAAEALCALAVVVRCAPELFVRTEVNLDPDRLEGLADRSRALATLHTAVTRLCDLVQDSQMEQGDEVVELLTVGMGRASALDRARMYSNDRLAAAMDILAAYQQRVIEEQAHRSAADVAAAQQKPMRRKKSRG